MASERRVLSADRARAAALQIRRRFTEDAELARARRLALYAAASGEVPTDELRRWAEGQGLAVLWPRATEAEGLAFARAESGELVPGRFGVLEPPGDFEPTVLSPGDVVVVPGVAFDRTGGRLGRGGGHYDRTLDAASEGVIFVGLGYAFQCVDQVPMGPHDRRVHALLTEDWLHWVKT